MNKRLQKIFDMIPQNSIGMIDVGTDHGYLPVALALSGFSGRIFASDINSDPLSKAIRCAEENNCAERINFTLAPGLSKCDPKSVDTIVIAGMGGDMICRILDESD